MEENNLSPKCIEKKSQFGPGHLQLDLMDVYLETCPTLCNGVCFQISVILNFLLPGESF